MPRTARSSITLLATRINGFGYFANSGTTRRQGLEAGFTLTSGQWEGNFSYTLLDATFRESLALSCSPSHPRAASSGTECVWKMKPARSRVNRNAVSPVSVLVPSWNQSRPEISS